MRLLPIRSFCRPSVELERVELPVCTRVCQTANLAKLRTTSHDDSVATPRAGSSPSSSSASPTEGAGIETHLISAHNDGESVKVVPAIKCDDTRRSVDTACLMSQEASSLASPSSAWGRPRGKNGKATACPAPSVNVICEGSVRARIRRSRSSESDASARQPPGKHLRQTRSMEICLSEPPANCGA
jgi:hypothetical protein